MTVEPVVRVAHDRAVTTLTLDSPANRNAPLPPRFVGDFQTAHPVPQGPDVGAVVLAHTGNTFCAGADLRDPPHPDALVALLRQIVELHKPVVAR